eukprot:CAMPEP_0113857766 /NCGR_PEP_ID=MMETSP0372-20130328/10556_1 /TAXON_ID=340204 /ORGANISM="Lankesteria abbotti" /LENGTH=62 /DNA_ID=CAMNT_0000834079 /DNA_START=41 /DNA_END=226 /DNA_ORIENTATION=+ /assembly_acc=CAM_ASM_000359
MTSDAIPCLESVVCTDMESDVMVGKKKLKKKPKPKTPTKNPLNAKILDFLRLLYAPETAPQS